MGRPASKTQNKYNIKQIWSIHREILRRHSVGQKPKQIAKDLGVTIQTISNLVNSDLGSAALEALNNRSDDEARDVTKRIKELAPEALDVVEEILTDDESEPKLRSGLAIKVLGLAGYVEPQKTQIAVGVGLLSQDDISNMRDSIHNSRSKMIETTAEVISQEA